MSTENEPFLLMDDTAFGKLGLKLARLELGEEIPESFDALNTEGFQLELQGKATKDIPGKANKENPTQTIAKKWRHFLE